MSSRHLQCNLHLFTVSGVPSLIKLTLGTTTNRQLFVTVFIGTYKLDLQATTEIPKASHFKATGQSNLFASRLTELSNGSMVVFSVNRVRCTLQVRWSSDTIGQLGCLEFNTISYSDGIRIIFYQSNLINMQKRNMNELNPEKKTI